jgi:uncharacterized membrane protein
MEEQFENKFDNKREAHFVNMMYGTYADVLFILFPFLVMGLQRLWNHEGIAILKQPDLSIAAAILAGMSVGKFVLGLISERRLGRYKERIVFFIALTLFFVLGPAIMLIVEIVNNVDVPKFVVFVQPILLIIAISLYSTAVSISNILTRQDDEDDREEYKTEQEEIPYREFRRQGEVVEPLNIQTRENKFNPDNQA